MRNDAALKADIVLAMTNRTERIFIAGFIAPVLIGTWALTPDHSSCLTEVFTQIKEIPGLTFEISETACDTLAKDASMSIAVWRNDPTSSAIKKTTLIKYGPPFGSTPRIALVKPHTLQITLTSIGSIYFRKRTWEATDINYDIGGVEYPNEDGDPEQPPGVLDTAIVLVRILHRAMKNPSPHTPRLPFQLDAPQPPTR